MSAGDVRMRAEDEAARQLAKTEFVRPVVLVAGAGTGKTATLVARVLVWALGPGWELAAEDTRQGLSEETAARVFEQVTAITFTERAAVEMKQRVARAIENLVGGKELIGVTADDLPDRARLKLRARALLIEIDRLHVETIHAFCRRILTSFTLEAGLHPGFEIDADGESLNAELDDMLGRFLFEAYGEAPDADALALLEQGVGPDKIADALRLLTSENTPAARLAEDPYPEDELRELGTTIAAKLQAFLDHAAAPLRNGKGSMKLALQMLDQIETALPRFAAATSAEDLAAAVESLDLKGDGKKLAQWAKDGPGKTEGNNFASEADLERARELARDIVTPLGSMASWNPALLRPAFRLFGRLLEQLESRLQRRGIVTFSELLRRTRVLFETRPDILARVREGMRQLLVDEVQDTDPIQYDIVRMLALEGERRPGLFLVGDPKQTIYSFRNADLEAFEDFLGEVASEGGTSAELVVNFRSAPPVLDEVERVMAPIMQQEAGLQPPFQKLLASPKKIDSVGFDAYGRRAVEHWNSWLRDPAASKFDADTKADDARRIEAESIAQDMVELHEQAGQPYKEMAILMRSTTQQEVYLRALRDAGVPYLVEKDKQFYRRREIIDATSILVTVLDPLNHLALLGFLRSSAVGLPDAAILPLWRGRFPAEITALDRPEPVRIARLDALIDRVQAALDPQLPGLGDLPHWAESLKFAVRALADLRANLQVLPADSFLMRLRSAFGFEYQEASRFLGAHRLANLDRLFRELLKVWTDPERGRLDAMSRLLRGIEDQKDEAEGSPGDQNSDAVRVMSVHKSKGLDFAHVYLVALHQGVPRSGRSDCLKSRGGRLEFRLLGAVTPGLAELEERSDRVSAAEAIRTLYVATTRAAERLVLCGSWPAAGSEQKDLTDQLSSMELIQHRQGSIPDWETMTDLDRRTAAEQVDDQGTRFLLPDHLGRNALRRQRAGQDANAGNGLAGLAELRAAQLAKLEREEVAALRTASGAKEEVALRDDEDPLAEEPARLLPRVAPGSRADLGTLIHRNLEIWPLDRSLADHLNAEADSLAERLEDAQFEALGDTLAASLRALASSKLGRLLEELRGAGRICARELPLAWRDGDTVLVGSIDLLYRSEDGEGWVIADFKTDRIEGNLEAKKALYLGQGRAYVQALRAHPMAQKKTVRFELWFLDADRVEVVNLD